MTVIFDEAGEREAVCIQRDEISRGASHCTVLFLLLHLSASSPLCTLAYRWRITTVTREFKQSFFFQVRQAELSAPLCRLQALPFSVGNKNGIKGEGKSPKKKPR